LIRYQSECSASRALGSVRSVSWPHTFFVPRAGGAGVRSHLPFISAGDIFQTVMVHSPRIEIKYCTQCRWLLRAAWMVQELLTTFQDEVGEVALVPGTGGVFEVRIGDEVIWSRKEQGRFPDIKELKQLVRDCIAPAKDLGHSENRGQ
jgi:selenoprotein W-related protein